MEYINTIIVISGEGTQGTIYYYLGRRTERAMKMHLKKERKTNRWARMIENVNGVGVNVETGLFETWPQGF